jgi:hypothetical protein
VSKKKRAWMRLYPNLLCHLRSVLSDRSSFNPALFRILFPHLISMTKEFLKAAWMAIEDEKDSICQSPSSEESSKALDELPRLLVMRSPRLVI